MFYRGPGFLAVVWFGSCLPPPPLPSVSSTGDTQGDWEKRDNLLKGEEGWGRGWSQIIWPREGMALHKSFSPLWYCFIVSDPMAWAWSWGQIWTWALPLLVGPAPHLSSGKSIPPFMFLIRKTAYEIFRKNWQKIKIPCHIKIRKELLNRLKRSAFVPIISRPNENVFFVCFDNKLQYRNVCAYILI
jgi:hypothetical protein